MMQFEFFPRLPALGIILVDFKEFYSRFTFFRRVNGELEFMLGIKSLTKTLTS